jgi:hypothetical protein
MRVASRYQGGHHRCAAAPARRNVTGDFGESASNGHHASLATSRAPPSLTAPLPSDAQYLWHDSVVFFHSGAIGDEGSFSLFVAGDMIVMRPLSNSDDPRFLQLMQEVRNADVAVVNLETLFREYKGYPQANSGGTYMGYSARNCAGFGVGRH